MSLKILSQRFQRSAKPADPPQGGQGSEDLEAVKRESARAQAQLKAAQEAQAKAEAAAAAAALERDNVLLERTVMEAVGAHRPHNPAHAMSLLRGRFEVKDGKVIHRTDAAKDVDATVKEFFGSDEGKYMLPAVVPGGGGGAPNNPHAPPAGPAPDLSTRDGATAYARGLTFSAAPAPAGTLQGQKAQTTP
jgi:hypothetical protein